MNKHEGPINGINLFIMGQLMFLLPSLVFAPFFTVLVVASVITEAWEYCTTTDFSPLNRAGTLITGIAFLYVLFEEVWDLTSNVATEIENNFADLKADNLSDSRPALERYRSISARVLKAHIIIVRVLEGVLIVGGTILSATGDLIALRVTQILNIHFPT